MTIDITYMVDFKQVPTLEKDANLNYVEGPQAAYWILWMVASVAPFDNAAIRSAVNLAIDRKAILDKVAFGHGKVANGVITPGYKTYYDPAVPEFTRDVAAAKAKLKEGGKPDGFEFAINVAQVPQFQASAQIILASLAEAGIKMNIKTVDDATLAKGIAGKEHMAHNRPTMAATWTTR